MARKNFFQSKRKLNPSYVKKMGYLLLDVKEYSNRFHLTIAGARERIYRRKVLATKYRKKYYIVVHPKSKDGIGVYYDAIDREFNNPK